MEIIVNAFSILNNTIAVEREYERKMKFRKQSEEDENREADIDRVNRVECRYEQMRKWRDGFSNVEDAKKT